MKQILAILTLTLLLSSCSGVDDKATPYNPYKLSYFNRMTPPIIVISNGSILGDTRILVRDSVGVIAGFNDNAFNSLKPGDTIIPSIYK